MMARRASIKAKYRGEEKRRKKEEKKEEGSSSASKVKFTS